MEHASQTRFLRKKNHDLPKKITLQRVDNTDSKTPMSEEEELKVFTFEEVEQHKANDDCWIVYNGKVYDVTSYIEEHPGGEEVILECGGADATEPFDDIGHSEDAHEILAKLLLGRVEGAPVKASVSSASTAEDSGSSNNLLLAVLVAILAGVAYYFFNQ